MTQANALNAATPPVHDAGAHAASQAHGTAASGADIVDRHTQGLNTDLPAVAHDLQQAAVQQPEAKTELVRSALERVRADDRGALISALSSTGLAEPEGLPAQAAKLSDKSQAPVATPEPAAAQAPSVAGKAAAATQPQATDKPVNQFPGEQAYQGAPDKPLETVIDPITAYALGGARLAVAVFPKTAGHWVAAAGSATYSAVASKVAGQDVSPAGMLWSAATGSWLAKVGPTLNMVKDAAGTVNMAKLATFRGVTWAASIEASQYAMKGTADHLASLSAGLGGAYITKGAPAIKAALEAKGPMIAKLWDGYVEAFRVVVPGAVVTGLTKARTDIADAVVHAKDSVAHAVQDVQDRFDSKPSAQSTQSR